MATRRRPRERGSTSVRRAGRPPRRAAAWRWRCCSRSTARRAGRTSPPGGGSTAGGRRYRTGFGRAPRNLDPARLRRAARPAIAALGSGDVPGRAVARCARQRRRRHRLPPHQPGALRARRICARRPRSRALRRLRRLGRPRPPGATSRSCWPHRRRRCSARCSGTCSCAWTTATRGATAPTATARIAPHLSRTVAFLADNDVPFTEDPDLRAEGHLRQLHRLAARAQLPGCLPRLCRRRGARPASLAAGAGRGRAPRAAGADLDRRARQPLRLLLLPAQLRDADGRSGRRRARARRAGAPRPAGWRRPPATTLEPWAHDASAGGDGATAAALRRRSDLELRPPGARRRPARARAGTALTPRCRPRRDRAAAPCATPTPADEPRAPPATPPAPPAGRRARRPRRPSCATGCAPAPPSRCACRRWPTWKPRCAPIACGAARRCRRRPGARLQRATRADAARCRRPARGRALAARLDAGVRQVAALDPAARLAATARCWRHAHAAARRRRSPAAAAPAGAAAVRAALRRPAHEEGCPTCATRSCSSTGLSRSIASPTWPDRRSGAPAQRDAHRRPAALACSARGSRCSRRAGWATADRAIDAGPTRRERDGECCGPARIPGLAAPQRHRSPVGAGGLGVGAAPRAPGCCWPARSTTNSSAIITASASPATPRWWWRAARCSSPRRTASPRRRLRRAPVRLPLAAHAAARVGRGPLAARLGGVGRPRRRSRARAWRPGRNAGLGPAGAAQRPRRPRRPSAGRAGAGLPRPLSRRRGARATGAPARRSARARRSRWSCAPAWAGPALPQRRVRPACGSSRWRR